MRSKAKPPTKAEHDRMRDAKPFPWNKVDRRGPSECWPWNRSLNTWGYGDVLWNGRRSNSSRAAYEDSFGPVPSGLVVCHRCDNPACCNPAHLWAATQAENLADCREKGRQVYRRGAGHHRPTAKVTEDDVRRMRKLYADGMPQTRIAILYGIDSSSTSRLVRGITWKHVK